MKTLLTFIVALTFILSSCSKEVEQVTPSTPDFVTGSYEGTDDGNSLGKMYKIILSKTGNSTVQIQNISDEGHTVFGTIHSNGIAFTINEQAFGSWTKISGTGIVENGKLTLNIEINPGSMVNNSSETFSGVKK